MIHLRDVERADLDALFALDQQCFPPGIAYSRATLRYFLSQPRFRSIVAEDDTSKAILGFIIAEVHLEHARRIGHIITIDVALSERRRGLGRTLMQEMLDLLAASEVATIRLEVAVDNLGAQEFYRQLGFAQTGRIPGFYLGTLDALVLERSLASIRAGVSPHCGG